MSPTPSWFPRIWTPIHRLFIHSSVVEGMTMKVMEHPISKPKIYLTS